MTAESVHHLYDNPVMGNQFWIVAERDNAGRAIRLQRVSEVDVVVVYTGDGKVDHYRVGCHPSRGGEIVYPPEDVVTTIDLDYYRSHPRR